MTNERDLLADSPTATSEARRETTTTIVKGLKMATPYRVRLFDGIDRCVAGQFVHCANDHHARSHADMVLARGGITRVEVWDGERQVYQKERRTAISAESSDREDPLSAAAR